MISLPVSTWKWYHVWQLTSLIQLGTSCVLFASLYFQLWGGSCSRKSEPCLIMQLRRSVFSIGALSFFISSPTLLPFFVFWYTAFLFCPNYSPSASLPLTSALPPYCTLFPQYDLCPLTPLLAILSTHPLAALPSHPPPHCFACLASPVLSIFLTPPILGTLPALPPPLSILSRNSECWGYKMDALVDDY